MGSAVMSLFCMMVPASLTEPMREARTDTQAEFDAIGFDYRFLPSHIRVPVPGLPGSRLEFKFDGCQTEPNWRARGLLMDMGTALCGPVLVIADQGAQMYLESIQGKASDGMWAPTLHQPALLPAAPRPALVDINAGAWAREREMREHTRAFRTLLFAGRT